MICNFDLREGGEIHNLVCTRRTLRFRLIGSFGYKQEQHSEIKKDTSPPRIFVRISLLQQPPNWDERKGKGIISLKRLS